MAAAASRRNTRMLLSPTTPPNRWPACFNSSVVVARRESSSNCHCKRRRLPMCLRKKGGLARRLKRLHRERPSAFLLVMDTTVLRWFPPLRATWVLEGEQAEVPLTGENAKPLVWG